MPSVDTRYRLIVLDVDGTLVDHERRISPTTLQALAAAKTAGIRVTLATGRMYASGLPYARTIGADAPLILYVVAPDNNAGGVADILWEHVLGRGWLPGE